MICVLLRFRLLLSSALAWRRTFGHPLPPRSQLLPRPRRNRSRDAALWHIHSSPKLKKHLCFCKMKWLLEFSSLTWYFVEDSLVGWGPSLVRHTHLLHPELWQGGEELLPQGIVEAARAVGARDQYAVGAFLGLLLEKKHIYLLWK